MATGSNIRVGDAERDATATQLREHYATGRLTLDELNERLDQTFKARTGADLKAVTRDLPALGSPWAGATAAGGGFGDGGQSHRTGQLPGGSRSQWGTAGPGRPVPVGRPGRPRRWVRFPAARAVRGCLDDSGPARGVGAAGPGRPVRVRVRRRAPAGDRVRPRGGGADPAFVRGAPGLRTALRPLRQTLVDANGRAAKPLVTDAAGGPSASVFGSPRRAVPPS